MAKKVTSATQENSKEVLESLTKLIVFVSGDKGGTGKSTFSRILLDTYLRSGLKVLAYDADQRNAHLSRHYGNKGLGVKQVIVTEKGEPDSIDSVFDELAVSDASLALVDLPAGVGEAFQRLDLELGLSELIQAAGFKATVVSVLSQTKECVNSLRELMQQYGNNLNYVVCQNLFYTDGKPGKFEVYRNSKTRNTFLGLNGIEIEMPLMPEVFNTLLDQGNLGYTEAIESPSLTISQKFRIKAWRNAMETELLKAGAYLGLDTNTVKQVS